MPPCRLMGPLVTPWLALCYPRRAGQAPANKRFAWLQQLDQPLVAYLEQLPLTLRLPSHRVIVVVSRFRRECFCSGQAASAASLSLGLGSVDAAGLSCGLASRRSSQRAKVQLGPQASARGFCRSCAPRPQHCLPFMQRLSIACPFCNMRLTPPSPGLLLLACSTRGWFQACRCTGSTS